MTEIKFLVNCIRSIFRACGAVHRRSNTYMKPTQIQGVLLKASHRLEQVIAVVILLAVAFRMVGLCWEIILTIQENLLDVSLSDFFAKALLLVMGIEFVKLLVLHTSASVLHVLLFTIVRQMIVTHTNALDTLLGVAAVAAIFAIKKFLYTREDQMDAPNQ